MRRTGFVIRFIAVGLIFLFACGDRYALKDETLFLSDESKEWLTDSEVGDVFVLVDSHGISESFRKNYTNSGFDEGNSYFFWIHTNKTLREYINETHLSTYGKNLEIGLSVDYKPFGDELIVNFMGLLIYYNLKFSTISHISYGYSTLWKDRDENSFAETVNIESFVTPIQSITVNGKIYTDLLQFTFVDFAETWNPFTVTEFTIAKHYGLISYRLNNGVEAFRVDLE